MREHLPASRTRFVGKLLSEREISGEGRRATRRGRLEADRRRDTMRRRSFQPVASQQRRRHDQQRRGQGPCLRNDAALRTAGGIVVSSRVGVPVGDVQFEFAAAGMMHTRHHEGVAFMKHRHRELQEQREKARHRGKTTVDANLGDAREDAHAEFWGTKRAADAVAVKRSPRSRSALTRGRCSATPAQPCGRCVGSTPCESWSPRRSSSRRWRSESGRQRTRTTVPPATTAPPAAWSTSQRSSRPRRASRLRSSLSTSRSLRTQTHRSRRSVTTRPPLAVLPPLPADFDPLLIRNSGACAPRLRSTRCRPPHGCRPGRACSRAIARRRIERARKSAGVARISRTIEPRRRSRAPG